MNNDEGVWVDVKVADCREGDTVRCRGNAAHRVFAEDDRALWSRSEHAGAVVQRLTRAAPADEWADMPGDAVGVRVGDTVRSIGADGRVYVSPARVTCVNTLVMYADTSDGEVAYSRAGSTVSRGIRWQYHVPTRRALEAADKPAPQPPDDPEAGPGGEWEGVPAERVDLNTAQTGDRYWRVDLGPWVNITALSAGLHSIGASGLTRWIRRASHPRHLANVAARGGVARVEYVAPVPGSTDTRPTLTVQRAPAPITPDPLAALRTEAARMMAGGHDARDVLGALDTYVCAPDVAPPTLGEFAAMVDLHARDRDNRLHSERHARCAHGRLATQHCGWCNMVLRRSDAAACVSDGNVWESAGD